MQTDSDTAQDKKKLCELVNKAELGFKEYLGFFTNYFMAFQALQDEKVVKYLDSKNKSNIPFYYIANKIQRVKADFIEAYFTNKQFAKINEKPSLKGSYFNPVTGSYVPFSRMDYSQMGHEAIKALQTAVDYYTVDDDECDLFMELSKIFDNLFIYGTAPCKVYWNNGIKLEAIEIKDIYYDPNGSSAKDNKYCVHIIYLTVEEIEELIEQGVFEQIDMDKVAPDRESEPYKRIELQEIYEKKGEITYVSTMFNKDVILRRGVEVAIDPITTGIIKTQKIDPNGDDAAVRTYGDAIIAPLIPLQREMTVLRNQQLDIVDRQLNPRYITNDNMLNPFDFTNQKQTVIRGNPDKLKELQTPNMKDSVFNVDRLSVEGQEAIGVTDYNSGNSSNKQLNNTATGISILTSESNKILSHYIRCCNETLIKPLFKKIVELVWLYGDAKFFYGIDRTQKLEYSIGVDVGLGATNKEQHFNSKNIAHQGMMQFATLMQDPARIQKAEKFYYKEILPLLGIENYEEYYNEQDEIQPGTITENQNMGVPTGLPGGQEAGPIGPGNF